MRLEAECEGFFASPWPHDARLRAEGTQDLTGFPKPAGDLVITKHMELFEARKGFGTMSALYVGFDGSLDADSLPEDPSASLSPDSAVYLANIERDSPDYGERTPIECTVRVAEGDCSGDLLACMPMPGFPLRPATRYGLFVTDALRGKDGRPVRPHPRWEMLRASDGEDSEGRLEAAYRPFFDHLSRDSGEREGEVVAGMPFTTQDPISPMLAIAEWLREQDPPSLADGGISEFPLGLPTDDNNYTAYAGSYETPTFQQGDSPFIGEGGHIAFSDDGQPEPTGVETVDFLLTVPKGPAPAGGFPIAMVVDDTVTDALVRSVEGVLPELARELAGIGVAAFTIDLPLYHSRNPSAAPDGVLFFNFSNLPAGRDNMRQGAADVLVARRLLDGLRVPADRAADGQEVRLDTDKVILLGHSVGSMVSALALSVGRGWLGAYLSSAQGTSLLPVFDKTDPVPILPAVRNLFGVGEEDAFDRFHPGFSLVLAFGEEASPAVFAPRIFDWSQEHALHLWVSQALEDRTTPLSGNDTLVTSLGLDPAGEIPRPIAGLAVQGRKRLELPVTGNRMASDGRRYTAVVSQLPGQGYSSFYVSADLRAQLKHWIASAVETGVAELDGPP